MTLHLFGTILSRSECLQYIEYDLYVGLTHPRLLYGHPVRQRGCMAHKHELHRQNICYGISPLLVLVFKWDLFTVRKIQNICQSYPWRLSQKTCIMLTLCSIMLYTVKTLITPNNDVILGQFFSRGESWSFFLSEHWLTLVWKEVLTLLSTPYR